MKCFVLNSNSNQVFSSEGFSLFYKLYSTGPGLSREIEFRYSTHVKQRLHRDGSIGPQQSLSKLSNSYTLKCTVKRKPCPSIQRTEKSFAISNQLLDIPVIPGAIYVDVYDKSSYYVLKFQTVLNKQMHN